MMNSSFLSLTGACGGVAFLTALLIGTAPAAAAAPDGTTADRFPIPVETLDARRAEIFARIDTDGDGLISAEEFSAHQPPARRGGGSGKHGRPGGKHPRPTEEQLATMEDALFAQLDANADGVLSRDEFSTKAMRSARREGMKATLFARTDHNGDGYLSPDEFPPRRAADMDLNQDGEITREEFRAGHQRDAG